MLTNHTLVLLRHKKRDSYVLINHNNHDYCDFSTHDSYDCALVKDSNHCFSAFTTQASRDFYFDNTQIMSLVPLPPNSHDPFVLIDCKGHYSSLFTHNNHNSFVLINHNNHDSCAFTTHDL